MAKIIKSHISLYIFCAYFLLVGCKNTEHVFIENNSNDKIHIKVTLMTKNGEQILESSIAEKDSEGWSYQADEEDKKIDKKFIKLTITNDKGCKIIFNRNDIIKLAKKSGSWKLNINQDTMNCK